METIKERYIKVTENIVTACNLVKRDSAEVKLVVVTKRQPAQKIIQVIEAGATILGENYPEEAWKKIINNPIMLTIQWHMIGNVQSRKIKYLVDYFNCIHTIDRLVSAQKIDEACAKVGKKMPALIEVNLSGEISKHGYPVYDKEKLNDFYDEIEKMLSLNWLSLTGLMTMPPSTNNQEDSRKIFRACRLLLEEISNRFNLPDFTQLSMGTSQDYEVAIQEGATFLRIGEAIMGERVNL